MRGIGVHQHLGGHGLGGKVEREQSLRIADALDEKLKTMTSKNQKLNLLRDSISS